MIQIENKQKKHPIAEAMLQTMAQRILSDLGCPDAELSVLIVDDAEIQQINRDYLQRDKPTNVISFAMQEGEGSGLNPSLLGDVVISADTAARDAVEVGKPIASELCFLLLHGILHLLGYDHERGTEQEALAMEEKEREVYAMLEREFNLAK
ncbi:MAG: rRNA maturation RNase YbeY [Desulfuromonas sp.]|nr:MAG: rRNA maturation RNase YbeY [Desulfuromonas sp.]